MTQETSINSFNQLRKELGHRQKEVLRAISILKEPSNLEISNFLGLPINVITPRTHELVGYGYVQAAGVKLSQTGKNVMTWKISSWHSPYDNYNPPMKEQGFENKRSQAI